jgi:PGF-CTERM protein
MARDVGRVAVTASLIALLIGTAPTVVAPSEPREEPGDTRPPVRVYVGETLNISSAQLTGDGTVGTNETTFVAVGDGPSFTVEPTSANFSGVQPGAYHAGNDTDIRADLQVVRPRVERLEVRGEDQQTVTDDPADPDDLGRVYIRAGFNFDDADRLDVTVVGPLGTEVGDGSIATSGERTVVELGEPTPGMYTVTVAGSELDAGNRTATVRVAGTTPTTVPTATPTPTPTATPTLISTSTSTLTSTPTPTPTVTPTATPTSTPFPETTVGDGPGFGVVGAILALVTPALYGRRRRN